MGESERVTLEPASPGREALLQTTPEQLPLRLPSSAASHLFLDLRPGAGLDPSTLNHVPLQCVSLRSISRPMRSQGWGSPGRPRQPPGACKEGRSR